MDFRKQNIDNLAVRITASWTVLDIHTHHTQTHWERPIILGLVRRTISNSQDPKQPWVKKQPGRVGVCPLLGLKAKQIYVHTKTPSCHDWFDHLRI